MTIITRHKVFFIDKSLWKNQKGDFFKKSHKILKMYCNYHIKIPH